MNELVEIMKCREQLGPTVMTIFYEVEPTDVKKQIGDFGKVFKKTCKGKSMEDLGRWRHAFVEVATIASYHSSNWDNEAAMIEKISADISNKLNRFTLSSDFNGLVGMGAHIENMEQLLCLDLNEVRMIGIWGPSGIGKTTIARLLFSKHSHSFDLSVFMENIKAFMCTRPACSDEYGLKLHLHQQLMAQIINQKDIEIPHLGVAQERLKDKKVFVILDDVDHLVQLDAMAKETRWFGPGSRIIITTQDRRLLRAHGINYIYKVDFPPHSEAFQIFCMNAFGQNFPKDGFEDFGQNFPKDGFEDIAWEVTYLAGIPPLGLRVMGSYFGGMSKQEWTEALPRLKTHLVSDIQSILKFSYDALDDKERDLYLHIAFFFNGEQTELVESCLEKNFSDARQGLHILIEKSLISIDQRLVQMHSLLARLGREIVRKQSIHDPGQHEFLVDTKEICEVLVDDTGSRSVIGIDLNLSQIEEKLDINEKAFEGMSNLQFLRVYGGSYGHNHRSLGNLSSYNQYGDQSCKRLHFPRGLSYMSQKLRFFHWDCYLMTCLPSKFQTKLLVKLYMPHSKLEKLWEGIQPLRNLKLMNFDYSSSMRELPDLSTAGSLQEMGLSQCSSIVELPSSIGNAITLQKLNLRGCSSLTKIPSTIGNATNLQTLDLGFGSNLEELPTSVGNFHKLKKLSLRGCSKLEVITININLESLDELDLTDCSLLKVFPEISTNIGKLLLCGTAIEEVPSSIKSWSRLRDLHMPYSENLKEFPHALDVITVLDLSNTEIREIGTWVKELPRLYLLELTGCRKLVSLPQLPDSLLLLNAGNCESLERLYCSFHNPEIYLNFGNCLKLNKEARDLIIQIPNKYAVLPSGEVPAYFSHRTNGDSITLKLDKMPLHTFWRFKVCILLFDKGEDCDSKTRSGTSRTMIKQSGSVVTCSTSEFILNPPLKEHLYTFEVEAEVTCSELVFEFKFDSDRWKIRECGVLQLFEVHKHDGYCASRTPQNTKQAGHEALESFWIHMNNQFIQVELPETKVNSKY